MAGVKGCHLVGSVPLADAESVFTKCAALAPGRLRRMPDGETGERKGFTMFQAAIFAAYPPMMVEFIQNAPINNNIHFTPEQIEEGIATIKKTGLQTGYDTAAIASYAKFCQLRDQGLIPPGVRFQVCLPAVASTIVAFVQRAFQAKTEPLYEEALFRAMRRIQDEIPHQDLAIQLDLAVDTALWEATNPETVKANSGLEWFPPWWEGDVKRYQTDYLLRFIKQVDQDVEFGVHNCYGDMEHRHWHEPASLAVVVERAQWVMKSSSHKFDFFHCPVPKSAENHIDAYLAPLKELLPLLEEHGTELYLGLVHENHPELTKKYVEAAKKILPRGFGVAAECGGGRMEWADFEDVLRISTDVSGSVL